MSLRLSEFHLETYDERFVLGLALGYLPEDVRERYSAAVEALEVRLSRTVCQPGGCSLCTDPDNPKPKGYDDDGNL